MAMGNDYTGKNTTPRYVVQEGEPSMYGRSEAVVDTATGRELCDAWCNEAPEDATVHRAFKPLLDEMNALAAELTRLRAVAEAARVLHAKLERETVDDPVAWADQMVGDALAALEGT